MNENQSSHNQINYWRILILATVLVIAFTVFVGRLFILQFLQADEWVAKAQDNNTEVFNLPALRGIIYDRNDTILARNIASHNITLTFADLPDDPGAIQEIFRELSVLIDLPVNQSELSTENPYVPCISDHGISQIALYGETASPFRPVQVKCDVDEEIAMIVMEKSSDWPGIGTEIQAIRDYPTGSLTSSIVGFLGPIPALQEEFYREQGFLSNRDKVGYAGVELQFQELLSGINGQRVAEVDVAGQVIRPDIEEPRPPQDGYSMRLTLDTRLQQAAEQILTDELAEWNAFFGEIK